MAPRHFTESCSVKGKFCRGHSEHLIISQISCRFPAVQHKCMNYLLIKVLVSRWAPRFRLLFISDAVAEQGWRSWTSSYARNRGLHPRWDKCFDSWIHTAELHICLCTSAFHESHTNQHVVSYFQWKWFYLENECIDLFEILLFWHKNKSSLAGKHVLQHAVHQETRIQKNLNDHGHHSTQWSFFVVRADKLNSKVHESAQFQVFPCTLQNAVCEQTVIRRMGVQRVRSLRIHMCLYGITFSCWKNGNPDSRSFGEICCQFLVFLTEKTKKRHKMGFGSVTPVSVSGDFLLITCLGFELFARFWFHESCSTGVQKSLQISVVKVEFKWSHCLWHNVRFHSLFPHNSSGRLCRH